MTIQITIPIVLDTLFAKLYDYYYICIYPECNLICNSCHCRERNIDAFSNATPLSAQ